MPPYTNFPLMDLAELSPFVNDTAKFSIEEPSLFLNPDSLKRPRSDSAPASPHRSFSLQDFHSPSPFVQTAAPFEDSSLFKNPVIPEIKKHQQKALKKLQELGLDSDARKDLTTRWSVRHSVKWSNNTRKRTLFQCRCGYDHHSRQKLEESKGASNYKGDWERSTPYPFTGCLAHIEIIEQDDGRVTWIAGILDHNAACQNAVLERRPPVPLHEHVYKVALEQLRNGASITAIQEKNQEMMNAKRYHDMKTYDPATANVRYIFLPTDHSSLYRKAAKGLGVDTRELPQYNVDDWLNPHSPNFRAGRSGVV
ncbi:hypothetical protein BDP27DRAFT_1374305 [Rhodocollybia butyracea]|uniref:Uncharacterized protein n=1 Tax=Rhodocollybia butyracea TaxID=206335 RepID=A0A9P5TWR1_9AGAR|nr:hypothetical protein BDP27DRAFT_1374305 [Rhodocollybia butyracea]